MISTAWMLFVAWFLNLFGFGNTVITGLQELIGIEIGLTTYYFIFGALGLIKNVGKCFKPDEVIRFSWKDFTKKD